MVTTHDCEPARIYKHESRPMPVFAAHPHDDAPEQIGTASTFAGAARVAQRHYVGTGYTPATIVQHAAGWFVY